MSEATGPTAQVVETVPISTAPASPESEPVKKLVVAVRGVGKQFRYATIKSVVDRFGVYCHHRVGTPLGSFYPSDPNDPGALPIPRPEGDPKFPEGLAGVVFAEIFWAKIPDDAVKANDTVEETKAWARTVVERVRALDCVRNKRETIKYEKASAVVNEMIETINVLENLLLLGRKTGVVDFDLQSLLNDYVNDVQIVTEFSNYRAKILDEFHITLQKLADKYGPEEIHIIAHSEGTVVSFLGLLEAFSGTKENSKWVNRVVGYMTIGSPIDKHIIMWPTLFDHLKPGTPKGSEKPSRTDNWVRVRPIQWHNYYDNGDPVGFQLDTARDWLKEGGWLSKPPQEQDLFRFTDDDDHGFTRYFFPGKAHTDYWNDDDVFKHFISAVVDSNEKKAPPPKRIWAAELTSRFLPYVICFIILLAGVYLIYKPTSHFVASSDGLPQMIRNVVAIAILLAGMTVMARVPRMATCWKAYLKTLGVFALSAFAYSRLIAPAAETIISGFTGKIVPGLAPFSIVWVIVLVSFFASGLSFRYPRLGLKPLVGLVTLVLFAVLLSIIDDTRKGIIPTTASGDPSEKGRIWPIAIGGAAFLYLWWLSALIFDLVYVWHRYIRDNVSHVVLRRLRVPRSHSAAKSASAN